VRKLLILALPERRAIKCPEIDAVIRARPEKWDGALAMAATDGLMHTGFRATAAMHPR
jgi:hypothetical protein